MQEHKPISANFVKLLCVFTILLVTMFVYFDGLLGGYLLDDLPNLKNIQIFKQYEGIEAFYRYITSFQGSGFKRPISTLSFLLNTTNLTVNPFNFKMTNLFIHIINGLLLYIVTYNIISLGKYKEKAFILAITNMAFWILHPYFVSTTLYVIQRMAILSTTFVLLGMYFYILARTSVNKDKKVHYLFLFVSLYICTTLAVLSKENGIILPFLLLLLEKMIIQPSGVQLLNRYSRLLFNILIAVILIAFIYKIPSFIEGYNQRDFTAIERIMTEARVVCYYIYNLFVPSYLSEGVYFDNISISTSLFQPSSTLIAILFLFFLISYTILTRKKYKLISFSIIFFFVAHIIESTIVPLELAFEHRNYLPSLFLFLPLSMLIHIKFGKYKFNYIFSFLVIIYLSFSTFKKTNLWSNNDKLAEVTVTNFPNSIRAIDYRVRYYHQNRNTPLAIKLLYDSIKIHSNIASLRINLFSLKCLNGSQTQKDFEFFLHEMRKIYFSRNDAASIKGLLGVLLQNDCLPNDTMNAIHFIKILRNSNGYSLNKIKKVVDEYSILFDFPLKRYESIYIQSILFMENYSDYNFIIRIIESLINKKNFALAKKLLTKLKLLINEQEHFFPNNRYLDIINNIYKKIENEDISNHSSKK